MGEESPDAASRILDDVEHLFDRTAAVLRAESAAARLDYIVDAISTLRFAEVSDVDIPTELDTEHVRDVVQRWMDVNPDLLASYIGVANRVRHDVEHLKTDQLTLFAERVEEIAASLDRSFGGA